MQKTILNTMKSLLHPSLYAFAIFFMLLVLYFPPLVLPVGSTTFSITSDKDALISFRSQLSSLDSTDALSSWTQNSSPCNWTRVICNRYGHRVIGLNLSSLGLIGPISPHIGNLSFLESLQLQNNQFSGDIPGEISNLRSLKVLNMSSNSLEGSIPSNIAMLRELVVVDLTFNKLIGTIPSEITLIPKLRVLNLGKNKLTGLIPPSLGNMSSLTNLNLGTNSLSGSIPSELGRLRRLRLLDVSINSLEGEIPSSIYNMSSLVYLVVASNNLWGELPFDVGDRLPNLLAFNFCINKFTGRIPGSLHNLTNIELIRMAHNRLHGSIPSGLGKLTSLKMYNMGYNRIVSSGDNWLDFVTSLANNTQLNFLSFEGNLIEGIIPQSIGNWSKVLSNLYMGENLLHGEIPTSIGQLQGLALLNMSYNQITGLIPTEITKLEGLQVLNLAKNSLSGGIPQSIGKLEKLNQLDLSSNKLIGTLPKEVFTFSSFGNILNLSHNLFSGTIPEEIGVLENAIAIDISNNQLSGYIPSSIMNCKSLEALDLSNNRLSGSISPKLQTLSSIQSLNLSFNDLEGEIPCQGVFKNLSKVALQGNPRLSSLHCQIARENHARRSIKWYIIVIIAMSTLFICLAITFFFYIVMTRKRKARNLSKTSDLTIKGGHEMVKYDELRQATRDFSQENLLGQGSFGKVFRGNLKDNIMVAIKVLDMNIGSPWKSFLAECEALKHVRHRNLVKLITICTSLDHKNTEFLALVYEFLSNGSLEDWIKGKRKKENGEGLNFVDRLNVAIDVASALDYMHHDSEVPVVHCDLKPSNVLLDEDMTAKIGDFGLAKLLMQSMDDQNYSISSTHLLKGSIGYMPPEYGLGERPSTAGDTYSFGVTLLELFTGKIPIHHTFPTQLTQLLLDPQLLQLQDAVFDNPRRTNTLEVLEESSTLIFEIGLSCTEIKPDRRISMRDALHKLKYVRDKLVKS